MRLETELCARSSDGRVGGVSVVVDVRPPPGEPDPARPAGAAWSWNERVEDGVSPDALGPKAATAVGMDARATSTAIVGACAARKTGATRSASRDERAAPGARC